VCCAVLCYTVLCCAVVQHDLTCCSDLFSSRQQQHCPTPLRIKLVYCCFTHSHKYHAHAYLLKTQNLYDIISIRFLYRVIPSSFTNSGSGSRVYRGRKIPVLRFTVRVADATGEVDTHISGKEAELFLGVTAGNFYRHVTVRRKVKSQLLSLCQSQFNASAPAPEPAVTTKNVITRRVTRGSHAQQQQQQTVIPTVPASVPLLALNLFSYLPAKHTGEAAVRLAVVGTSLNQL
jgi:hypothetical protein